MLQATENVANDMSTITIPQPDAESLLSKAVIISFKTGRFGNNRKVRRNEVSISAYDVQDGVEKTVGQDVVKVSKELLNAQELQAITSFDAQTRGRLLTYCLPSYVEDGYYFLPITLVETVDAMLSTAKKDRDGMVARFIGVYEQKKEEARLRLGPLYREKDYPSVAAVRQSFSWAVRYISFSVPGSLKEISSTLFNQEKARQEKMWEEAASEVRAALRESLVGLLEHAIGKLSYQSNGKPQVFRDSMVKNMNEFLDLFARRNLTNDDDLAALVGQTRQLMVDVDPTALRSNLGTRDRVRTGFEEIKRTMETMLIDRPLRQIDLDD